MTTYEEFSKACTLQVVQTLYAVAFADSHLAPIWEGIRTEFNEFSREKRYVKSLWAFFQEPQRHWVASKSAAWFEAHEIPSEFHCHSVHLCDLGTSEVQKFAARLAKAMELDHNTERDLGYVFLYILTAFESGTYGERSDVQVFISFLGLREQQTDSEEAAGVRFLEVSATVLLAHPNPKFVFDSQIYVQACIALLQGRTLIRWNSYNDQTNVSNLYTSTMDYNFPEKQIKRLSMTSGNLETIVASLAAFARLHGTDSSEDEWINQDSFKWLARGMPHAFDVFGLGRKLIAHLWLRQELSDVRKKIQKSDTFKQQVDFEVEKRSSKKRPRTEDEAVDKTEEPDAKIARTEEKAD